jgi:hypothetical protein
MNTGGVGVGGAGAGRTLRTVKKIMLRTMSRLMSHKIIWRFFIFIPSVQC